MAYSVNWLTKVVTIPKADLTVISAPDEIYELNVVSFWENIHDIQDGEGMPYDTIMKSNAPTTFGPRGVVIINDYRIEFEDGAYQVTLVGANSDIDINRVQNNVSISNKVFNGLDGDAIAEAVWGYEGASLGGGVCTQDLVYEVIPEKEISFILTQPASFDVLGDEVLIRHESPRVSVNVNEQISIGVGCG